MASGAVRPDNDGHDKDAHDRDVHDNGGRDNGGAVGTGANAPLGRRSRARTVSGVLMATIALTMAVVGVSRTATAQEGANDPVAITFGLGIAVPDSYDHSGGGGTSTNTLNEVQWIGNYDCDDVVSFFLTVTHDPTAGGLGGSRSAEIDLEFAAGANGQPGVGLTDILGVTRVPGDPGEVGDGNGSATLLDESLDGPYTDGGTLSGTVRVDNLDPGDTAVVRIDVRATCDGTPSSGILYAESTGAREVAPNERSIGSGQLRQQIIEVIEEGTVTTTPNTAPPTTTTEAPSDEEPPSSTTTEPPAPTTTQPTTTTTATPNRALLVSKALVGNADGDGSQSVTAGDVLTYEVTVQNTGDVALQNLQISDDLPGAGALDCHGFSGTLGPSETVDCTVDYTVTDADVATRSVTNTATATAGEVSDTSDPVVVQTAPEEAIVLDGYIPVSDTPTRLQTPGSNVSSLPLTGARVDGFLWIAAALATAGAAYVVAGRRPRAVRA
jgi:uncharacterized repeat protein (TIGR01451 family)